jgi:hypothetical protein
VTLRILYRSSSQAMLRDHDEKADAAAVPAGG